MAVTNDEVSRIGCASVDHGMSKDGVEALFVGGYWYYEVLHRFKYNMTESQLRSGACSSVELKSSSCSDCRVVEPVPVELADISG